MIGVDSNIIFSAIEPDDTNHTEALLRLGAAGRAEVLTLSPVVYTELMASTMRSFIRAFLYRAEVAVLWAMTESVWERAGLAFGEYATIRHGRQLPRRIVAYFLIAAYAEHHGLGVLTFDDTVFKVVFPEVRLVA